MLLAPVDHTVITVDADGSADHTTIQAAIDAASNGDVVLIHPGDYAAFHLDKRLSLIGVAGGPRPLVDGVSEITAAGAVTLSNLHLESVMAVDVTGRLTIDSCTLQQVGALGSYGGALNLLRCDHVEVIDSALKGVPFTFQEIDGALVAIDSTVWVTGSQLIGHSWQGPILTSPCWKEAAGSGLWAFRSTVRIQRSTLRGGNGTTTGGECAQLGSFSGHGGHGVYARRSEVWIRNTSEDVLHGGFGPSAGGTGGPGLSVWARDNSTVRVSSATLTGGVPDADATSEILFSTEQPLLERLGSGEPGGIFVLRLRGPANAIGVLAVGAPSTPFPLAGWDAPIGLVSPLLAILPLTTQGLNLPVDVELTVPATFGPAQAGMLLRAQVLFPGLAGWDDPTCGRRQTTWRS